MKIITPVGTSIFTNYFDFSKDQNVICKYKWIAEKEKKGENLESLRLTYNVDISHIEKTVKNWAKGNIKSASAELSSLIKLCDFYNDTLEVYFIESDTVFSSVAVSILKIILASDPKIHVANSFNISGLLVNDPIKFKANGIPNLIEKLNEIIGNHSSDVILNITGGFKSVIPFIVIYGQINSILTCYIYEDADELIWMPAFPIYFDFSYVEDYYSAFEAANKEKEQNLPTTVEFLKFIDNDKNEAQKRLDDFLEKQIFRKSNDKVKLDTYGKLLLSYYQKSPGLDIGTHIGDYMELKLFEYFSSTNPSLQISRNKFFNNMEADIFILDNDNKKATVIECKPGGNIPFKDINEKKIKQLLPLIMKKHTNYSVEMHIYLYHHREILDCLKSKMKNSVQLAKNSGANMKWYWINTEKFSLSKFSQDKIKCILEEN